MAWTTPITWVTGQIVTAAQQNANVRDNELYLYGGAAGRKPSFNVYSTTLGLSVANATETAITSGLTVGEDTDSAWTAGTGTWTCQTAGVYIGKTFTSWAASTVGNRYVTFIGTSLSYLDSMLASADSSGRQVIHIEDRFSVGNTIQPKVQQSSGGALTLNTFAFEMAWIGA